jgi:glycosyltransferase involved in cell wall biosynthesis
MKRTLAIAKNMLPPNEHDLFEHLVNKGWDITLLLSTEKEPDIKYQRQDYTKYSFKVKKSKNVLVNLKRFKIKTGYLHIQYGLWNDLSELNPDIILSSQMGIRTVIAICYGFMRKTPVVIWMGVSAFTERNNSFFRELFRKLLVKLVPCICTNLTEAEKYFVYNLNVPIKKIFHTPYAFDVVRYRASVEEARCDADHLRKQLKLNNVVFLYVGKMSENKGLYELVRSIEVIDDSLLGIMSFLFVGGSLPETLRIRLSQKNVGFVNVPFVQPEHLYQYYAVADVFIFPSLNDEWGVVVNEAAAAGLPIISSKYAGATRDLVIDGFNGVTIDPYDTQNTSKAILKMLGITRETRKEWGCNSFELALKIDVDFTVTNMDMALVSALQNK